MPFPSLEQESGHLVSLLVSLASKRSSRRDATNDDMPFTQSFEFEGGENFESSNELDIHISNEVEHDDFEKSEDILDHQSYKDVAEVVTTNLEFDNDIFYMEHESFSYRFD